MSERARDNTRQSAFDKPSAGSVLAWKRIEWRINTDYNRSMHQYPCVYRCAIQSPLNRLFDYLPPQASTSVLSQARPGMRLWVPFGRRRIVAILLEIAQSSEIAPDKLRTAEQFIDQRPLLDESYFQFFQWVADYYHHPVGDTVFGFLPSLLRKGRNADTTIASTERTWQLSRHGQGLISDNNDRVLKRAPKQSQLLRALLEQGVLTQAELADSGFSASITKTLSDKGLIEPASPSKHRKSDANKSAEVHLQANPEQALAIDAVAAHMDSYRCFLLHGITGSGKTEVYLQLIKRCLQAGKQALVLVPEIGLTPQMLDRFQRRFGGHILALNSGMTDVQRLNAWLTARNGDAHIVIGTRSALLAPLPALGLIIVDEEHDSSYKQQDGLRYSARDLAIKRAQLNDIPVLLGSATPSLESLANATQGKYNLLALTERAGGALPPQINLSDCNEPFAADGLAFTVIDAARRHLKEGAQVLIFINRRGFAPSLLCSQCGWIAKCAACEVRMTAHLMGNQLICHHCEQRELWPKQCPSCQHQPLQTLGSGTQKLEQTLEHHFPDVPVIRVDRDSTQRKGSLHSKLAMAQSGEPCVLLGTQMLAKGHHFPKLSMVAILDADTALYSSDYRGPERMAQTITQVAGRAGRGDRPGEVYVQSQLPNHPLLIQITTDSYAEFANRLLEERSALALPPFSKSAALLGEHRALEELLECMRTLRHNVEQSLATQGLGDVMTVGPVPAPMPRKSNRFRAQMILYSQQPGTLHRYLSSLRTALDKNTPPRGMRLAIDVDPIDTN
ncbi:MAG: primosomal protein N' [Pseudomonadota bacterium]